MLNKIITLFRIKKNFSVLRLYEYWEIILESRRLIPLKTSFMQNFILLRRNSVLVISLLNVNRVISGLRIFFFSGLYSRLNIRKNWRFSFFTNWFRKYSWFDNFSIIFLIKLSSTKYSKFCLINLYKNRISLELKQIVCIFTNSSGFSLK